MIRDNGGEGWLDTTLGEIGQYLNGRGFKKSEWSETGRMIIRIQDLTGSRSAPNYFRGECEDRHVVREGDLLISWAATLDAFLWKGPEAVLNQHIFKVESKIARRLHYYVVKHVLDDMRRRAHGSGMVHITKSEFEKTRVSVPASVQEQELLADRIDEYMTRLDSAVDSLLRAQASLKRMRRLLYDSAVKADRVSRWCQLASIAQPGRDAFVDGPFGSNLKTRDYAEEGPRVIRLQNIGHGDFIDASAHISEDHYLRLERHSAEASDVLIAALDDDPPRACLVPPWLGPAIVKADCFRLRVNQEVVDPRWVVYALNSSVVKKQAALAVHGVGRRRVTLSSARQLLIPVPPVPEQLRIIEHTERLESVRAALQAQVQASLDHAEALREQTLARLLSPSSAQAAA